MSLAIEAFVENVRSYCEWIEAREHDLLKARQLILSLMTSIPYLVAPPSNKDGDAEYPHKGHDEWKLIHKSLADFPFQYYREVFDPLEMGNDEPVTGDVHDDLADIYGDLWHGLQAHESGDGIYAVGHWRESYFQHWGDHAASALRAIDQHYRTERLA